MPFEIVVDGKISKCHLAECIDIAGKPFGVVFNETVTSRTDQRQILSTRFGPAKPHRSRIYQLSSFEPGDLVSQISTADPGKFVAFEKYSKLPPASGLQAYESRQLCQALKNHCKDFMTWLPSDVDDNLWSLRTRLGSVEGTTDKAADNKDTISELCGIATGPLAPLVAANIRPVILTDLETTGGRAMKEETSATEDAIEDTNTVEEERMRIHKRKWDQSDTSGSRVQAANRTAIRSPSPSGFIWTKVTFTAPQIAPQKPEPARLSPRRDKVLPGFSRSVNALDVW